MRREQGSAVAIVLLFLAIVSMVGAAVILQSRMDTRFNSAMQNMDSMLNLADAGSITQFKNLPRVEPMRPSTLDPVVVGNPVALAVASGSIAYRAIYVAPAPRNLAAGYETSSGGYGSSAYHASYWVAEADGSTLSSSQISQAATVQSAAVQIFPN